MALSRDDWEEAFAVLGGTRTEVGAKLGVKRHQVYIRLQALHKSTQPDKEMHLLLLLRKEKKEIGHQLEHMLVHPRLAQELQEKADAIEDLLRLLEPKITFQAKYLMAILDEKERA